MLGVKQIYQLEEWVCQFSCQIVIFFLLKKALKINQEMIALHTPEQPVMASFDGKKIQLSETRNLLDREHAMLV